MPDIELLEEKPISMVEVKSKLIEDSKGAKELNFRAKKVKEYLDKIKIDEKKSQEIIKKLSGLDIVRLKDRHIIKISDIQLSDIDSLKSIFIGENLTLKQEDLTKILEALK